MNDPLPEGVRELLDDRVFNFAQAAQKHYKTNDLVVSLDLSAANPELEAIPRERLAGSDDAPEEVRRKVAKPASMLAAKLGSPAQSFWFVVTFESEKYEK